MTTVYLPDSEPRPEVWKLSDSPSSLAGLRIGVLDNGLSFAAFVLSFAAERLAADTGATVSLVTKKGPFGMSANAAIPVARDIFERLLEETDIVLTGLADCGSCTAYSVSDAIELERAGKPAVVVTTTRFEPIAVTLSKSFGLADVRKRALPHPLGATDEPTLREWVAAAAQRTVSLLLGA